MALDEHKPQQDAAEELGEGDEGDRLLERLRSESVLAGAIALPATARTFTGLSSVNDAPRSHA